MTCTCAPALPLPASRLRSVHLASARSAVTTCPAWSVACAASAAMGGAGEPGVLRLRLLDHREEPLRAVPPLLRPSL